VKCHLRNLYRRLRVTNRIEATRWLLDRGIQVEAPARPKHLTLAG
jgi:DNA-binding NarL/FixJ family response regulator